MKQELLEVTNDLIRIPSTVDRPDALVKIVEYCRNFYAGEKNLHIRLYEQNGKPSIVVSTVDSLTPDILLLGHLDVVPARPDQFIPKVEGNKLFARGACDMKSGNAAMMLLLREFARSANPPSCAVMLTTDEEVAGKDGTRYLINDVGYRSKVAFVPDGGYAPEEVVLVSKGVLQIRLHASGFAAHSSLPWEGKNAIDLLVQKILKIQSLFSPAQENVWQTTCSLNRIEGGEAGNQVPAQASCTLDIRFTEAMPGEKIISQIKEIMTEEQALEIRFNEPLSATDKNHNIITAYQTALKKIKGVAPNFQQSTSAHDGRFLTQYGIPVVVSRPLSGGLHGPEEWLDINSLVDFYDIYKETILSFAQNKK